MKSKIISVLILITMIIAIVMFVAIAIVSVKYNISSMNITNDLYTKVYLAGILIAIVAGIFFFLEFFIRTLGESIRDLKNG